MTESMTGKIALITEADGVPGLASAILLSACGAIIVVTDVAGTDFGPLRAAIPDAERLLVVEAGLLGQGPAAVAPTPSMAA